RFSRTPLALDAAPGTVSPASEDAPKGELTDPEKHKRLLDEFKKTAHKNFELRAEYVREVGRKKQEVLEELTHLTPVERLHDATPADKAVDFILVSEEED